MPALYIGSCHHKYNKNVIKSQCDLRFAILDLRLITGCICDRSSDKADNINEINDSMVRKLFVFYMFFVVILFSNESR